MYITTNVSALQSWLDLSNTQSQMNTTLTQLSTGSRLNSAADDPAALAITEQMQSQIGGLAQAGQNAQAGSSMMQTADGALGQIQNILQSMYSLATQAASDTYQASDRADIQTEIDQYTQAIADIANQTAFNGKNLLDGVLGSVQFLIGADAGQDLTFTMGAADPVSLGIAGTRPTSASFTSESVPSGSLGTLGLYSGTDPDHPYGSSDLTGGSYGIDVTAQDATLNGTDINTTGAAPDASTAAATEGSVGAGWLVYTGAGDQSIDLKITTGAASGVVASVQYSLDGGATYQAATIDEFGDYQLGATGATLVAGGITTNSAAGATDTYALDLAPASATLTLVDGSGNAIGAGTTVGGVSVAAQTVAVGDPSSGQGLTVAYNSAALFGVTDFDIGLVDGIAPGGQPLANPIQVSTDSGNAATGAGGTVTGLATAPYGLSVMSSQLAGQAQSAIASALTQIDAERAQVGAVTDRLGQAASDVATSGSNLTQAQGGIRDTDMAMSMVDLVREQLVQQSGTAMLAASDQIPRLLLKMLP